MNRREKISISEDKIGNLSFLLLKVPNYLILFLTGAWFLCLIITSSIITYGLISNPEKMDAEIFIFFFPFIIVGIFVLKSFLWNLRGKEKIEIGNGELIIEKLGTIMTFRDKFDLNQINSFKLTEKQHSPWIFRVYGLTGGEIEFEYYGNKKVFGQSLNKDEAKSIVTLLNKKLLSPTKALR